MDRSRLLLDDQSTETLRLRFEMHLPAMGLPEVEVVRKGPLHYEGPAWLSSMWFGFLMASRTTFVWRDPNFEGDFVKGDTLTQLGIKIEDRSSECGALDMRVSAEWVKSVAEWLVSEAADDELSALYAARAEHLINDQLMRDAEQKKK